MQRPLLMSVLHVVWCVFAFLPNIFRHPPSSCTSLYICVGIILIFQEREGLNKATQYFHVFPNIGNVTKAFMVFRTACFFCGETNDKFRGNHRPPTSVPSRANGLKRFWRPLRKSMLDSNPLSKPLEGVNVYEIVTFPESNSSQLGQDTFLVVLVLSALEEYHRARARWDSGRIIADSTGWGSSQMMTWLSCRRISPPKVIAIAVHYTLHVQYQQ